MGIQMIGISVFGIYAIACAIACSAVFVSAMAYRDLGRGLLRILQRRERDNSLDDVEGLTDEIANYYSSYARHNPSVHKRYACIVNWIDDVLMQTNMFDGKKHKWGSWFNSYYEILEQVQALLGQRYPFYRCTSGQVQILQDITALKKSGSPSSVEEILEKTEREFVRLNGEGKKNERNNLLSIVIGVAGILVSVLLTILQMVG